MSSVDDERVEPPNTGALDFGTMPQLLGYHVRLAHLAMLRRWGSDMREIGTTQKQYTVLRLIQLNPGCSQIDLGVALGTDRATMMALIAKLDGRGLLIRRKSPSDGRRQELTLSEEGERLTDLGNRLVHQHEERYDRLFVGRELPSFMQMLARVIAGPPEPNERD